MLNNFMIFSSTCTKMQLGANGTYEWNPDLSKLELKYLTNISNSMLQHHPQYSIFGIMRQYHDHARGKNHCEIFICQICAMLQSILFQVVMTFASDEKLASISMVNATTRLTNKFICCWINLCRSKLVKNEALESIIWALIVEFNVYCKFKAHALFLACKNICVIYNHPPSYSRQIMCYFFLNDCHSFKKYLNLRRKARKINDGWYSKRDIFDSIGDDPLLTQYCFSHQLSAKQRLLIVRGCRSIPMSKIYASNKTNVQALHDEKYATILGNIAMFKECNYNGCNKKDVILKRCKKCVSVYYCSRSCQKKDWLNHRNVCKSLKSRDYSVNFQT